MLSVSLFFECASVLIVIHCHLGCDYWLLVQPFLATRGEVRDICTTYMRRKI